MSLVSSGGKINTYKPSLSLRSQLPCHRNDQSCAWKGRPTAGELCVQNAIRAGEESGRTASEAIDFPIQITTQPSLSFLLETCICGHSRGTLRSPIFSLNLRIPENRQGGLLDRPNKFRRSALPYEIRRKPGSITRDQSILCRHFTFAQPRH